MSTLRIDESELNRARAAAGIHSDRELAHRLGVHPGTVSRVLAGHSEPGPRFIAAALLKLPTSFDALFVIEPDPEAITE